MLPVAARSGATGDDGLTTSGGASGLTARFEDLLAAARLLDTAADGLFTTGRELGRLLLCADLAQAAVLCPVEAAEAELALGLAATGPHGALTICAELEVTTRLVRWAVELYGAVDAALADLAEQGYDAAGFGLGTALPGVAAGVALLAELDPLLPAQAQAGLYDHPWLQEALTRIAPGAVQGGAFALASALPAGPAVLVALSGGRWPTGDFHGALVGLLALAGHVGAFADTGRFGVAARGAPRTVDLRRERFLGTVLREQALLARDRRQVQVVEVRHGRRRSWVVQIPGTQEWAPTRGENPVDLTTNVHLEAMSGPSRMQGVVTQAMARAGVGGHDPVMLVGHSQGGLVAAAMATDPRLPYRVTSVVTAGSPIGRYDIPGRVSVLSLEDEQDVVPRLDGRTNPDRPSWLTLTRDLTRGAPPAPGHDVDSAHSVENYAQTGALADRSDDPGVAAWRRANATFFSDGEPASAQRYEISALGPARDGEAVP